MKDTEYTLLKMIRHIEDVGFLASKLNIDASYRVEIDHYIYLTACIIKDQILKTNSLKVKV
jgi:hypothetical protein